MSAQSSELTIRLTRAQSRLVLQALAELPFKSVFELIGNLNGQAHHLFAADGMTHAYDFVFTPDELKHCIKALGALPYQQVHGVLSHIHAQLHEHAATIDQDDMADDPL